MFGKSGKNICVVFAFAIITQVCSLEITLSPEWYTCKVEFKDQDAKIKVITDCATKTGYKLPVDSSLEAIQDEMKALSAADFDDKCFAKCLYENMKLPKDGKVDTTLGDYFKNSNITEPLLKEVTKVFEDCVKETEPKFKDEKEISCKMLAMVDYCSFKKVVDNQKAFEEICSKGSR